MRNKPNMVSDYMTTSVITLTPEMDILAASQILVKNNISGAPVVDDFGKMVGILTEKDCFKITLNAGYFNEFGGKVEEFMSRQVGTVTPQMSVFELADKFMQGQHRRFPVVEENQLVGMISRRDILKALLILAQ